MLICKRFFYPCPAVSAIDRAGWAYRMKIAAKAKLWFGGDIAEVKCRIQGGIQWYVAALYADIEEM